MAILLLLRNIFWRNILPKNSHDSRLLASAKKYNIFCSKVQLVGNSIRQKELENLSKVKEQSQEKIAELVRSVSKCLQS